MPADAENPIVSLTWAGEHGAGNGVGAAIPHVGDTVFPSCGPVTLVATMRSAGYEVSEIAPAMHNTFHGSATDLAAWAHAAGIPALVLPDPMLAAGYGEAIAGALAQACKLTSTDVLASKKHADIDAKQATQQLRAYGYSARDAQIALQATYFPPTGLPLAGNLFWPDARQIAPVLVAAGYSPEQIAIGSIGLCASAAGDDILNAFGSCSLLRAGFPAMTAQSAFQTLTSPGVYAPFPASIAVQNIYKVELPH